jgi:hypothetical protein
LHSFGEGRATWSPAAWRWRPLPRRTRLAIALILPLGALASAGALAAAQWPRYWAWIAPERTPLGFLEALFLFSGALLAGLLGLLAVFEERSLSERRAWALASLGFAFLGADERFALHERLRDNVLADLGVGLPWGSPGDYVLLLYLGAGLSLLPAVLEPLRSDRPAVGLFAAGVVLAALSVLADSFDVRAMAPATERLEQSLEEVVEALAGSLLAGALLLYFSGRLARLARVGGRRLAPSLDAGTRPCAIGDG